MTNPLKPKFVQKILNDWNSNLNDIDMEKEKVMHVLSVLLDELTKNIWHDSVMCWTLSAENDESGSDSLLLKMTIYEKYSISLSQIKELVVKCGVLSYNIYFRTIKGVLEIMIEISNDNAPVWRILLTI